jgi:hypothetical protein
MTEAALFLDNQPINDSDLVDLLRRNGQINNLLQELVLERALNDVEIAPDEQAGFLSEFRSQQNLLSDEAFASFLEQRLITKELLLQTLSRPHKVVKYREERWGPRANSLYLQRKERYDLIRYRRLEAANADVMQEVYFRLKDGEENWESLAQQIQSSNPSATSLVGPVPVGDVEQSLLHDLREAGEGKLLKPLQLGNNTVVAQLEEIIPSEFNAELRTLLLREAFEEWLAEECSRMLQKVRFPA